MMFSKLAVCMTNRCSAACDMCCFGCSPKKKTHLSTEQIKSSIRQAAETGAFKSVGFTGGEPFHYYDQLLECSAYGKELGLRITINTNGFWAKNEKLAREKLLALREAGVEYLSFSADSYHQAYVPVDVLRAALRLTYECGMQSSLSIMETVDSQDLITYTEALRPEIYLTALTPHPMLPIGKAMESFSEDKYIRFFETKEAKCTFMGLLQLNFDGNYYMCCSQFCREIPPTNLGKASEVEIKDTERMITSNDYLYVMLRHGFIWYIDLAKKKGFEIPDYLCSPCHCCYFVFRNKKLMSAIEEEVREEAGRLRVQHLLGN